MKRKKIKYYQKAQIPIKVIKNTKRISDKSQKEIKFGLSKQFLKKIGNLLLIFSIISAQTFLLSAFEAHVVNVTAHICSPSETRTMGYWKNHPNVYLNCLPQNLGYENISTEEEVDQVFENANADEMIDMLRAQLLAMKFNIACFGIDPCDGEEFDGKTLGVIVAEADQLLQEQPEPPREVLEEMKNLLDYLNNLHQIKYCSTLPSWFNGFNIFSEAPVMEASVMEASVIEAPVINEPVISDNSNQELFILQELFISGINTNYSGNTTSTEATEILTNDFGSETPPTEEPPTEEPPTEEPPVEEPSTPEPPTDETPTEEISITEPPITEPPVEEPPVEEPPTDESPVPEPSETTIETNPPDNESVIE